MRLDAVTAEIRPRSDWEAVDLGFAMVRRDFWRCFSVWWLAVLVPTVAAGWWLWERPMLWLLLFWWWKPVGSRLVLFELSRRLFGERPTWRASLREIPRAWCRRFFYRLIWARLSPWLPVMLSVEDLEGLRGKAYKQRRRQVARRGEGAVMWIYFIADLASCWIGLAVFLVLQMFMPQGQEGPWQMAVETWNPDTPMDIPALILRTAAGCVMLAMSLTDVFVTGAGFGIYINNRTWNEGWDVELAFKRLARRLTKVAVVFAAFFVMWGATTVSAEESRDPAEVIREVKEDPAFKVHTVTDKVPVSSGSSFWKWPDWLRFDRAPEWLAYVFVVSVIGLLIAAIAWLVWKNRHALVLRGVERGDVRISPTARVVMGMEVSRESLPDDVPAAAWTLWNQGRHQEALALLYRGAISRVIEIGRVAIQESDTEGDCVRRVVEAGAVVHPDYFRSITRVWIALAYAGQRPADHEVESLCQRWPFVEGRGA